MGILDWLLYREKTWVVFYKRKAAFFIINSNTDAVYTHMIDEATRFTKSEAARLADDLGWLDHTYLEAGE
jgi:hypothetical protein